jgi:hypothetical protein
MAKQNLFLECHDFIVSMQCALKLAHYSTAVIVTMIIHDHVYLLQPAAMDDDGDDDDDSDGDGDDEHEGG